MSAKRSSLSNQKTVMKTTFGTLNKSGEVKINLEVDLNTLPSADPIAFGYGISYGRSMHEKRKAPDHGLKHSELSPEYLRGFLFGYTGILVPEGTKIRKGQEANFSLLHLNVLKEDGSQ